MPNALWDLSQSALILAKVTSGAGAESRLDWSSAGARPFAGVFCPRFAEEAIPMMCHWSAGFAGCPALSLPRYASITCGSLETWA